MVEKRVPCSKHEVFDFYKSGWQKYKRRSLSDNIFSEQFP